MSNQYKWANKEHTFVKKYPDSYINVSNKDFQKYFLSGGGVDPYKTFAELKESKQNEKKVECENHIYSFYSPAKQSSMALGIYPPLEKDAMVLFIADCIELENETHDLIEACTTETQLDEITVTWPTL